MICDVLGFAASKLACIPARHEAGARNRLGMSVPSRPMDFNDVVYLCSSTTMEKSLSSARFVGSSDVDEKTELRMIALLRASKVGGWRRNTKLFGKPDFIFLAQRLAVFVDGCFWHRHPNCKFSYTPKSRVEFWLPKFQKNVARDRLVTRELRKAGWHVVRIWECQLTRQKQARAMQRLRTVLSESRP